MPEGKRFDRKKLKTQTREESRPNGEAAVSEIPGLTILFHPDSQRIGETAHLSGAECPGEAVSRTQPLFAQPGQSRLGPLADVYLSRTPFSIHWDRRRRRITFKRDDCSGRILVQGEKMGETAQWPDSQLQSGISLLLSRRVGLLLHWVDPLSESGHQSDWGLIGRSRAIHNLKQQGQGGVIGPYCIVEKIGSGGMGEVYRAYDSRLDREVAIKYLRSESASDPRSRQRFRREARAAAALNHPGIVQIHDILESPDGDAIVMEWVRGQTLAEVLDHQPPQWRERVARRCTCSMTTTP